VNLSSYFAGFRSRPESCSCGCWIEKDQPSGPRLGATAAAEKLRIATYEGPAALVRVEHVIAARSCALRQLSYGMSL
jgi:hypothetical protein